MNLAEDFGFADESGEFVNDAQVLRYVAAINPEATLAEFVAAAVEAGYKANSAGNRFRESRKCSMEMDAAFYDLQKDGKMVAKNNLNR